MKISLNKLKNSKVYFYNSTEPVGLFSDAVIDKHGKIAGWVVKTISIVPISKIIVSDDIDSISDGKIVLKRGCVLKSSKQLKEITDTGLIYSEKINIAVTPDLKHKKLKDISFDFETGQICDVVILKNIISGKEDLSINKIFATDNTIYIQK